MSVSDDRPQSAPRRRRRLRKPTWRGWFTIGLITLIVAIVAAWAIDYGTLHGRIARNTTVENVDLSRLDGAPLDAALARADARYGKGTVVFIIDGHDHPMSAGDLGLHVDAGATLAAARKVGRSDPPVLRPVDWVLSWIRPRRVPITVTLDQAKLTRALATLPGQTPVVEPRIVGTID
ncbi:MAG: hypothetical protein JST73_12025, partial [Actinobacteria bacterium]|nr:hypothetical protein [Actinomycetota bacterium]